MTRDINGVPQLGKLGAAPPTPIRFGSRVLNWTQGNLTLTVHNNWLTALSIIIITINYVLRFYCLLL